MSDVGFKAIAMSSPLSYMSNEQPSVVVLIPMIRFMKYSVNALLVEQKA